MFRSSSYWFAAMAGLSLVAFWPMYLSKLPHGSDRYTHLHALLMTAWLGLLIVQPLLIRRGQRALHRALGAVSYVLVPAIVVASILLTHLRARKMDEAAFVAEGRFFYLPLSAVVLFAIAWLLAIAYRRQPALHARFMVCTGLTLIDPLVARIAFFHFPPLPSPLLYQAIGYGLTDLVLLVLIVRERHQRQGRGAFPVMLAVFATAHLLWFTAAQTPGWLAVVRWFRDLPLT
jgi:uncharacterized membrane protein YozB (DUF420 family)